MEERQDFMIEEGLHQAVVFKLSHGALYLKLIIFSTMEMSTNVGFFHSPLEETMLAVVWISLPNLSPDLFAKKSLLSIASTIGKPTTIDKATQIKSRPGMTRIKVILDLMEKLTNHIRLQFVDGKSGKLIETVDVDQSKGTSLDRQLVASTFEQNHVDSIDVDTSNIGVQTTTKNKGDCNNQQVTTNEVQSKEVRLNLMSNATKTAGGTPKVRVNALRVDSGQKLMDLGQKTMDTSDVENFGQHTTGKQVRLTENDRDLIQEKQVSPLALNSKLSPEAPVFVLKCVLARKNESSALVSNTIDLGEDPLDEDGMDLDEDSLDEENMLDICFDRVARERDISPRQQRSGSNKSKKKTYGRQHSWDGKMTEEFVPRHLPIRQTKQNHLTVSIGLTISNKFIKKVAEVRYFIRISETARHSLVVNLL
ncbi:hypothetical protein H5410_008221 [Solanum commersonii]|uniref:DUF4283 domain-containing protein n=1 Tax=Solanum commersonii TaxID=4109 RepID=A0A9J6AF39_SOLCO|nr:hypothetical protein H5410_008221 [Solanum commersonii]